MSSRKHVFFVFFKAFFYLPKVVPPFHVLKGIIPIERLEHSGSKSFLTQKTSQAKPHQAGAWAEALKILAELQQEDQVELIWAAVALGIVANLFLDQLND